MINKRKKKYFTLLIALGLFLITASISWAKSEKPIVITAEEIRERAENFLINNLDWPPESMDIKVRYEAKDLSFKEGNLSLVFDMRKNSRAIGRIPLTVQVKLNDKFIRRLRVDAKVGVYQDVVKTVNSIQRGNVISESDVIIERTRSEKIFQNVATQLDKVIGKAAKKNIQIGKIIKIRDMKEVPTIKRGSRVRIIAKRGSMRITAPGAAREDGFKNSIVQVVNLETKKLVYAEVIDANTVEVKF
jgi:flagella basal body P-ring formation protein FlgA